MKLRKMRKLLLLLSVVASGVLIWNKSIIQNSDFITNESDQEVFFKTGQEKLDAEYELKKKKHSTPGYQKSDMPSMYANMLNELKTRDGEGKPAYGSNYRMNELNKARILESKVNPLAKFASRPTLTFDERGPGNVPGRTRAVVIDPDDADTWVAGAAGGGIWKTTDGGSSWTNKSTDMPNLAISQIVMAGSDKNILYAGTGEGWGASAGFVKGNGIFKSTDLGETWVQLDATADNDDFQVVNRMIVDPSDADILLSVNNNDQLFASFTSGIFKSEDGGTSWTEVYSSTSGRVQQIVADPDDFNIQYVTINSTGVMKSTDAGDTWTDMSEGLFPSGRMELAISPVNTDRLYLSNEGPRDPEDASSYIPELYVSSDAGANWNQLTDTNGVPNFLGDQGWYDHTILAHPFDEDVVYVAGVNMFKFTMAEGEETSDPQVTNVEEGADFMDLVNFSADANGGTISVGESASASVEIRFGSGIGQKAHRFTVNKQAAGVPDADYQYEDYVDVPFEVWDIDNDVQLMAAFRDQQEDGEFNLIEAFTDGEDGTNHSREYLFISSEEYDDTTPNSNMSTDGGHVFENMFFIWPVLAEDETWDAENLPTSEFVINWGTIVRKMMTTDNITDAYGQFSGKNSFSQTQGATSTEGVHPDNHNIVSIITDEENEEFQLILTNDGGLYKSNSGTDPGFNDGDWTFSGSGYNTTQFYAVDKMPGANRYIGGAQDNGTWMTPSGTEGSATADYGRANGGDGFGVAWHSQNPDMLLSCVYYNSIEVSTDGGATFTNATSGLTGSGDGEQSPFNTKIENVDSDPDIVFAVGAGGVFKSTDFASNWELIPISENWALRSFLDVKISKANNNIVWAGGAMSDSESLQVSTDGGASFTATSNFEDVTLGQISGLATHPTEESTAYALFSFAKGPKILKTEDQGETWEDISGFGTGSSSTTGFPDVAVYDLCVMPHETSTIWVGTEIGIFESTDDGASWHILDADMPAVSIWELKQVDDQIIVGTHGRGIFSTTISELPEQGYNPEISLVSNSINDDAVITISLISESTALEIYVDGEMIHSDQETRSAGDYEFVTSTTLEKNSEIYARSYFDDLPYVSRISTSSPISYEDPVESYVNDFESTTSDFYGYGFEIGSGAGLGGNSINTPDNYKNGANYTYLLKTPIIVSSDSEANKIEFTEVVVVEPDNDYVVVEGSLDGATWLPLIDSYDASADSDWETLFEDSASPVSANAKQRSITLTDTFDPGDEILIRFRLNSDESTNGWGWSIDDLEIQNVVLSANKKVELASSIYPNPVVNGNTMSIQFDNLNAGNVSLSMRNISGQIVYSDAISLLSGENKVDFQIPSYLKSGVYFMDVRNMNSNSSKTHKILINNNH
ncbi:MAG: T9SS type A sorting domain-containing protein [Reichenbachiella sp.]|uniref:T9SS type A sorting domain-containing protein n=1 Tax=Reichenbachiella sp. TaxID=2184521 RepID=UPI003297FAE0